MKRLAALVLVALVLGNCTGEPSAPPARLEAAVLRATDTIRFHARAVVYRCQAGRGTLVEAIGYASGVMVWLRSPQDSTAGSYPILGMRDTVTRRGAIVALRFAAQAVPHTVSLDSGTVVVSDSGAVRHVEINGSGLDISGGTRPKLQARFRALPAPADSAPCTS